MTDNTQAVAAINMDMLSNPSDWTWEAWVMSRIHSLKVYNPKPGTPADPAKAWKFIIKLEDSWDQVVVEGPISYNILSVLQVMSWECYPMNAAWETMQDSVYFYTNEHSMYTRKEEPVGLRGWDSVLWWFPKWQLLSMLKAKMLNGNINPFWKQGKTNEGKPYDGSNITKVMVVYWRFESWDYKWDYFKSYVKMPYFGINYKDGATVDPKEGTILHSVSQWLKKFNEIRVANGMNAVKSIDPSQVIVRHSVKLSEKGHYLSHYDYEMLQLETWVSNQDDVAQIHELQKEHLAEKFWEITPMQNIIVEWGKATLEAANQDYKTNTSTVWSAIEAPMNDVQVETITPEDVTNTFSHANQATSSWAPY